MKDDAKQTEAENLIPAARNGDAAATTEILRLVRAFARGICRVGGPRDAAGFDWEDVAQEAAHKLLAAGFRQYRGTGSDRSYLYAVVKATMIQMARSARRRRRREEAVVVDREAAPENPLGQIEVRGLLRRLGDDCRELITRVVFLDEGYSALAGELQITESSVRSRLHRCLEKARRVAAEGEGR